MQSMKPILFSTPMIQAAPERRNKEVRTMSTTAHRTAARESMRRAIAADPERFRAQWRKSNRTAREKHAEHKRARQAAQNAIERGALVRPDSCSVCGASGRIEAHHEDYSKPLNVVWLCTECHGARMYMTLQEIKQERGTKYGTQTND